uniref:Uncharacterized protein n=1 Tax=Riptortus pedestris TaxID=329032 RepID=R4WCS9_RIPPE|nr:unknown secreted protein [Riptortus pedestris]
MASFKTLFFLFAMLAVALAIEGVREKKQILLTHLGDDGSWFPGKYDPVAIPALPYAYRSIYW